MTDSLELAKEWVVCKPNDMNSLVHKYEMDIEARQNMRKLVDSDANKVIKVFSTLL